MVCETCGKEFSRTNIINGKKIRLNVKRKKCLDCLPFTKNGDERVCKLCKKLIKHNHVCRTCAEKKDRLRLKLKAIEYLGGKCSRCGFCGHPAAFEFHHSFGEKNFIISDSRRMSWKKIKEELSKCEILCSNCHREEHASYDNDFIKWVLAVIEKVDNIVIENYEFLNSIT